MPMRPAARWSTNALTRGDNHPEPKWSLVSGELTMPRTTDIWRRLAWVGRRFLRLLWLRGGRFRTSARRGRREVPVVGKEVIDDRFIHQCQSGVGACLRSMIPDNRTKYSGQIWRPAA